MGQGDKEGTRPSEAAKLISTGLLAWLLRCGFACGSNVPVVISLVLKQRFSQGLRSICSFVRQTPVLLRGRLMQSSSSGSWGKRCACRSSDDIGDDKRDTVVVRKLFQCGSKTLRE